ncbi:hypothetical protein M409DRAFT_56424 [Zasmidium cellare ATCC 36951]|uniref:Zinc/iron permease n=1 Tax=Zasmidium cellare ATCC 36951 TaxID=1080233 RepID=A0A6A6CF92_ZASCE|nr:uncharacterized protein M409DRAFT_56424 [Zasmidium cellare ATCC 36951]KAF2164592.1 hypothetical protein M409DRAFT_56424 [Zasmidium cellare ATCC 36951]
MPLSNDDRGWIMTGLSGVACIFGAAFICVDVIVRLFPGKKGWRIQDSDTFLSLSLSLSFGVMLFSALYSMLPSAKSSLIKGGFSSQKAAWILIACFIGGVVGIQVLSRIMHKFVPHNVVDCEHHHEDEEAHKEDHDLHEHSHDEHNHHHTKPQGKQSRTASHAGHISKPQRSTSHPASSGHGASIALDGGVDDHRSHAMPETTEVRPSLNQRPTLQKQITESISKLTVGKDPSCDCDGPCYGYSDLCQSECFKNVNARGGFKAPKPTTGVQRPSAVKNATATESTPLLQGIEEEPIRRPHTRAAPESNTIAHAGELDHDQGPSDDSSGTVVNVDGATQLRKTTSHESEDDEHPEHHHHHVPTNAFLSIGLQTSIAIALHKLPEGFITYATNHANPQLGVSVFLALFIHNITEGFAMALPLYLAINSRLKAMLISFVLGGLSQPLGAGVAALWFKLAGKSGWEPSEAVYGGMFAVTAGIMASVALQLFAESLDLTHSKHLCMIGAFCGMTILGISSALTA